MTGPWIFFPSGLVPDAVYRALATVSRETR